ncbi:hypothetical protein OUZ56_012325 [Daphnia magna]|uniref:Uncharacterized protein n=1 Tax=Daphnia magna TaxID=35525 RepID=A0ABQ9Z2Q4_9CRUS|nr:hypothetical protein OUZ56_012325 [Daphnia magna]
MSIGGCYKNVSMETKIKILSNHSLKKAQKKQKLMKQRDFKCSNAATKISSGVSQNKVRYKPFTPYEALVSETNKYALRFD